MDASEKFKNGLQTKKEEKKKPTPKGPPFTTVIDLLRAGTKPRRALHPIFTVPTRLKNGESLSHSEIESIHKVLRSAGFDGCQPPESLRNLVDAEGMPELEYACRTYLRAYFRNLMKKHDL